MPGSIKMWYSQDNKGSWITFVIYNESGKVESIAIYRLSEWEKLLAGQAA